MQTTGSSSMSGAVAAANKELVSRFYHEVFVNWDLTLVDTLVDPTLGQKVRTQAHKDSEIFILGSGQLSQILIMKLTIQSPRVIASWCAGDSLEHTWALSANANQQAGLSR